MSNALLPLDGPPPSAPGPQGAAQWFFQCCCHSCISLFEEIGRAVILLFSSLYWMFRPPFRVRQLMEQFDFVGAQSILLIGLTGGFTGMVSVLQGYSGLHRYGAESMIGATVALGLARELGPVLSALMIIGRVGSAFTAELGSMRNTQQIDALASMAVEPVQYLVAPRIIAATVSLPVLTMIFCFFGMVGGYWVAVAYLGLDAGMFLGGVRYYLDLEDVAHGLTKSFAFGLIFSLIACSEGYHARGGARGVGLATTRSVVVSAALVLIGDYVMTSLMFRHG
ncbi:MAG: MlaE family ABC transporter permease [Desulfomonilaceae bacterium]